METEIYQGILRKMVPVLQVPVAYSLHFRDVILNLNAYLGKTIRLSFTGNIFCIQCERKIKKNVSTRILFAMFSEVARV